VARSGLKGERPLEKSCGTDRPGLAGPSAERDCDDHRVGFLPDVPSVVSIHKKGSLLDHSSENHIGQNEPSGSRPTSRGGTEVKKEHETKEDGRYIIFYSFEDEGEDKGEDSVEGSTL
jgi:hypothetical protein